MNRSQSRLFNVDTRRSLPKVFLKSTAVRAGFSFADVVLPNEKTVRVGHLRFRYLDWGNDAALKLTPRMTDGSDLAYGVSIGPRLLGRRRR